jgi:amino acid transporter
MVLVKMIILLVVISVGAFYVNTDNWSPFAPNGLGGVLQGVSAVFFAYIGFDAISTTAEECKTLRKTFRVPMFFIRDYIVLYYMWLSACITGTVSYKKSLWSPSLLCIHKRILTGFPGIIAI